MARNDQGERAEPEPVREPAGYLAYVRGDPSQCLCGAEQHGNGFLVISPFDGIESFYGSPVESQCPQTIDGIGGKSYHPAGIQDFNRVSKRLGVVSRQDFCFHSSMIARPAPGVQIQGPAFKAISNQQAIQSEEVSSQKAGDFGSLEEDFRSLSPLF